MLRRNTLWYQPISLMSYTEFWKRQPLEVPFDKKQRPLSQLPGEYVLVSRDQMRLQNVNEDGISLASNV